MAGVFNGLFGLGRSREEDSPSRKLRELFESYAGLAREKQFALEEFLEAGSVKGPARLSLPSKTLSLDGGRFVYAVQILGTRADGDNTWLWAWANPGPQGQGFASELLSSVEKVRAAAVSAALEIVDVRPSHLPGAEGNQEYFLHARKNPLE